MANLRKKTIRELLELDGGITTMTSCTLEAINNLTENDLFNVFLVLKLQKEVQEEIIFRLPYKYLETYFDVNEEGSGHEKEK